MVKLLEKFEELKENYNKRQKQIDEMINNINEMAKAHAEGMLAMRRAMEQLDESIGIMQDDYMALKDELKALKNNSWLRFFGVK